MKDNTILLLVAAAVLAYVLYKKYQTYSNLQFVTKGISFGGGGFQVQVGAQNTSSLPVQYNSFAGMLYVNGSAVGNVTDFTQAVIQPNSETDIVFNVSPNPLGIANDIVTSLDSGQFAINSANLTGTANVAGNQLPVNLKLA